METVIIVIHLMLVAVLIAVVLVQKSEGGGLGIGGGGGGGFMSSRGTANLLTRTTAIVAGLFFVTSLLLSWIANYERAPTSIINNTTAPLSQPGTPVAPSGGGVLDTLRQQEGQAPGAPQPPRSQ